MLRTITTYHHPHHRDFEAPNARKGNSLFHAAHIADFDRHIHFRNCAKPLIVAGRGHDERGLHLDDRSHKFENRPHIQHFQKLRSAVVQHIVQYPEKR